MKVCFLLQQHSLAATLTFGAGHRWADLQQAAAAIDLAESASATS